MICCYRYWELISFFHNASIKINSKEARVYTPVLAENSHNNHLGSILKKTYEVVINIDTYN